MVEKSSSHESSNLTGAELTGSFSHQAVAPSDIGGFAFQGASKMSTHGHETLHLRYSDGLSTLSLFESVRRTTRPTLVAHSRPITIGKAGVARASRDMHYNTINWDRGRLNLTLVGDLPVATLAALAAGL